MKKGYTITAAALGLLLLPCVVAAQGTDVVAPVATPQADAPSPDGQYKMRSPGLPPQGVMKRSPAPAPAMTPRPDLGAWWKNSAIAAEIGLSEQQISQIEQTFFDHRLKLIDLKATVEREETRLQPLMEADQVDEARIGPQIDKVLAARSALEKTNVMMMLSIRKVLTVDQWKKLESMRHHREDALQMKMKMEQENRRRQMQREKQVEEELRRRQMIERRNAPPPPPVPDAPDYPELP